MLRRLTLVGKYKNAQAYALFPTTMEPIEGPSPTRQVLHLHAVVHPLPLPAWVRAFGSQDQDVL